MTRDIVIVLGTDGCVVRRSDDGGRTFRKIYVLAELDCPEPVAAVHFVNPQIGYLFLRNGNVLRTTDAGETFGAARRCPAPRGAPAVAARSRPTRSSPTPMPASCSSAAATGLPHDRRRHLVVAGARHRAGTSQRCAR